MKLLTILGARPQFIKAGSVSREISKSERLKEIIVHTGQHYDSNMSDIFFEELKIPKPHYFLGIGGNTHGAMTGQMIEKIEEIALVEKPDCILVYGDTNSTLAGAIVAGKLKIKLAHIEAGLRSYNMNMPEEINRILTDRISNILFCPTKKSVDNLKLEGFDNFKCNIILSGDVMKDGINFYRQFSIKPKQDFEDEFILATIHRAENTDNLVALESIISALNTIHKTRTKVILPIHPRTRKIITSNNIHVDFELLDPVGYLQMIWLIDHSNLVMTDSGGLQKEAFLLEKNCIILRNETEWLELVDLNYNALAGSQSEEILRIFEEFEFNKKFSKDLYGNGDASRTIIKYLEENLCAEYSE